MGYQGQFRTLVENERSEIDSPNLTYPAITLGLLESFYDLSHVPWSLYWRPLFSPLGAIHYIFRTPLF
jgi:hypothetical protein